MGGATIPLLGNHINNLGKPQIQKISFLNLALFVDVNVKINVSKF